MAFHEFFDFSFQTPANALLFTVMLALAVRMARHSDGDRPEAATAPAWKLRIGAICISGIGCILIVCALRQEKTPYPYDIKEPKSSVDAFALISAHPAK